MSRYCFVKSYVSCVIQINTDKETWVSESSYIHAFDGLDAVHHQMEEEALTNAMNEIGYKYLKTYEYPLPNGKKLTKVLKSKGIPFDSTLRRV